MVQMKSQHSLALTAALNYVKNNAPQLVYSEISKALAEQPAQQEQSCYCPNCEVMSKELAELKKQKPVAWLEILRNNRTATDEVIGAFLRGHAEHLTSEKFVLSTPAAPQPVPQQEPVASEPTDAELFKAFTRSEGGPNPYYRCNTCGDTEPGLREYLSAHWLKHNNPPMVHEFARAIEAAHGIGEHMTKLNEMWAALAAYQPQADAAGHGISWAKMCKEKTYAAVDAAIDDAAAAYATAYAAAAWDAAAAADAADAATDAYDAAYADAKKWAQEAIYRINKVLIKPPPPPAQRTWVGLTDEEIINVMPDDDTPMSLGEAFSKFAELIEAKLKEKNT